MHPRLDYKMILAVLKSGQVRVSQEFTAFFTLSEFGFARGDKVHSKDPVTVKVAKKLGVSGVILRCWINEYDEYGKVRFRI